DDEQFALDLLKSQKILFSHGRAFNWKDPDHFRLVFLPDTQTLTSALERLGNFMADYKQKH
ncbi:MAG: aminotransferase, partial [Corynebacterium propinquum]